MRKYIVTEIVALVCITFKKGVLMCIFYAGAGKKTL